VTERAKPGYDGRPVVLVHLPLSRAQPDLTACSGEPFTPADESVTGVPMLLCLACQWAGGLRQRA
jgi:hypothetical protein